MVPLTHLLLSSIQRLLDPFGEESSPSLEVRANLVFSHGHLFPARLSSPSTVLLPSAASSNCLLLSDDFNSRRRRWSKSASAKILRSFRHTVVDLGRLFKLVSNLRRRGGNAAVSSDDEERKPVAFQV